MIHLSSLYKYQPVTECTLSNLREHQIWFSKPSSLNDIYDCAISPRMRKPREEEYAKILQLYREKIGEQYIDPRFHNGDSPTPYFKDLVNRQVDESPQLMKDASDKFGVACFSQLKCFSETMDNLLLWGHYADGHKGICLEFDTSFEPFPKAEEVKYSPTMPSYTLMDVFLNPETAARQRVLVKAGCWQYEREWRILGARDSPSKYKPECLTGVFFGVGIDQNHKCQVMKILQDSSVKFYQMYRDEDSFRLNRTQISQCF